MKKLQLNKSEWLLVLTGAYCVISVMMNLLCMKALSFGTSFVWMDGGTLVSWLVFLLANVVTEVYGKRTAILISVVATVVAFAANVVASLEVLIPTLPEYAEQAEHFAYIFSNGPRTIVASAIAFLVGNVINVEIIDRLKQRAVRLNNDNRHRFTFRAVVSTIIGQMCDNAIFQCLAFAPVGLSLYEMFWRDIATSVVTTTCVETFIESLFIPLLTIPLTKYLSKKA